MSAIDVPGLAEELSAAYTEGQPVAVPPSARNPDFDLTAAYAVEAELARRRHANGRAAVGRKVGFANRAMWRVLKLDTLVWAHMYSDTVAYAEGGAASLSLSKRYAPRIEPEVVFKMNRALPPSGCDQATVLEATEWLAPGFEIVDCVFPDWKFQPPDFVACFGLHAGLIVGTPRRIAPADIPHLLDALARFTVKLSKHDAVVAEGSGRNVLRSPALCVAELAGALGRQPDTSPLGSGELVSSGSLTESQPIAAGDVWSASFDGIDLPQLTLQLVP